MSLSFEQFERQWQQSGELCTDTVLDVAWRRYQHVQADDHETKPESAEPSLEQLQAALKPILQHPEIAARVSRYKFFTLRAGTIPWTPTGIFVLEEQPVSIFATGRTWRSKLLDLYLPPQFNLWYRIGVNGSVFNSTHDTKTFNCTADQAGEELYVTNQFPGGFAARMGGRVGGNLSAYDTAEGAFQVVIIQWKEGMNIYEDVRGSLSRMHGLSLHLAANGNSEADPYGLISTGLERMSSNYITEHFPAGWKLLWFLGQSEIFYKEIGEESDTGEPLIRCVPNHNVGILQKDLLPTVALTPSTTTTWSWNITALPSRLREDASISHDYLSLAFEFENGRDLTYTWSWELPKDFGYWCPMAAWCDREYHVVIRTGTEQLGQWHREKRNIYDDYISYINEGDASRAVPKQIVRVWLIAGNRWQRHKGEMLIKRIRLFDESSLDEPMRIL